MHHPNEPLGENPKYPCDICQSQKFVRCIICKLKIHIKSNKTDKKTYDKLKNDKEVSMICIKCNKEIFPFFLLSQIIQIHTINNS